jgi:hypothetical protein
MTPATTSAYSGAIIREMHGGTAINGGEAWRTAPRVTTGFWHDFVLPSKSAAM